MARILYGVAGEGLGHAVRSKIVIESLTQSNKVRIAASSKAYSYLSKFFDAEEIDYFRIIYRDNKAANLLTFFNNLIRFPAIVARGWKILRIINEFKPDVIITDFEPLVSYFACFKKIPLISIDNQHIITKGIHKDIPKKYWLDAIATKLVIKLFIPKSGKFFINSFYSCRLKDKNSILIKPLLRKEIVDSKTSGKSHILVYQTSKSNNKLIKELQKINEKFIVYGFYENKNLGNVILKDISEKEFLKDLASCKAVITNGGFTLISEALYLKKPILLIPVKRQFEQILNAIYVERLGYGILAEETSREIIEKFIKNIPKFRKKLMSYKRYRNDEALRKINEYVKNLSLHPQADNLRNAVLVH